MSHLTIALIAAAVPITITTLRYAPYIFIRERSLCAADLRAMSDAYSAGFREGLTPRTTSNETTDG